MSLGGPGAHVTFGRHGVRQTIGIPGTGMYYTHQSGRQSHKVRAWPTDETPAATPDVHESRPAWLWAILSILHVLGWLLYAILWVAVHLIVLLVEMGLGALFALVVLAASGAGRRRRRW